VGCAAPKGYYTASPGAKNLISWQVNPASTPRQFLPRLHFQPADILKAALDIQANIPDFASAVSEHNRCPLGSRISKNTSAIGHPTALNVSGVRLGARRTPS
jgi:hypothetical protein